MTSPEPALALLLPTPAAVPTALTLAEIAGLIPIEPDAVPADPWSLAEQRLICPVPDTDERGTLAHELLQRHVAVVLVVGDEDLDAARLVDSIRRHARPVDWRRAEGTALDPVHVIVASQIAQGRTMAEAAAHAHLSERSAHRRLAEARATLGLRSTAAVCAAVTAAISRLTDTSAGTNA